MTGVKVVPALAGVLGLSFVSVAGAQTAVAAASGTQQVVVNAAQDEASRDFAAAKIIIGRKQIVDSGVQNVNELLKKEPAVTTGKDGKPGLLGLPGYTQILVNGLPPSGRDVMSLDLSEVERIEISKSTTAENGPFSIAGTINVVLRQHVRQQQQTASLQMRADGASPGLNGSWTLSQSEASSPFSSTLNLTAGQSERRSSGNEQQVLSNGSGVLPQYQTQRTRWDRNQYVSLSTEMVLQLEHGSVSFKPNFGHVQTWNDKEEARQWQSGRHWQVQGQASSGLSGLVLPLNWQREDEDWGESEFNLRWSRNVISNEQRRLEQESITSNNGSNNGSSALREQNAQEINYDWLLSLTQRKTLRGGHRLRAGLELQQNHREPVTLYRLNGLPDTSLVALGSQISQWTQKRRVFVQDDWRVSPLLALNAGVSLADQLSDAQEVSGASQSCYRVLSPSLHLAKKLEHDPKSQFRISLARSFREPDADALLLNPSVNPLAACTPASGCAGNSIDTADSSGNPALRPERALALNVSYEQHLKGDSKLTLEAYQRQIHGKTGTELLLLPVAWANVPRWVQRPANLGDADVTGVNLDWRLGLKDWQADAPKLEVRGNLGWARSELKDWPGPDNRVDGSLPWRAKLGLSYNAASLPLRLDLDASWLPGDWLRNNLSRTTYTAHQTSLAMTAAWTVNRNAKLVLNLDNLLAQDRTGISRYQTSAGTLETRSLSSSHLRLSLRGEFRL